MEEACSHWDSDWDLLEAGMWYAPELFKQKKGLLEGGRVV